MHSQWWRVGLFGAALAAGLVWGQDLARDRSIGDIETVALFDGAMPTGVTVSRQGRIFINYPRWGDAVEYTVAELVNGQAVAYPNAEINRFEPDRQTDRFLSVQSVVIDPQDRLWVLDTGSPEFRRTTFGGPKLVGIDLAGNRIFKKILFPQDVALPTTYLNDVRFDLGRGKEGMAYITDSASEGPNAIIVVDLASGKSWRRLHQHSSTGPDPVFVPIVEGEQIWATDAAGKRTRWALGSDGIAIDTTRRLLYYCPLSSRRLFGVSLDALSDPGRSEADVAATVADLGEKGAADGLEADAEGRVYATNYENNAVERRRSDGSWETLAHDPRMLWPDTMSLAGGYLYFTCNQLHRQKRFQAGKDLRVKPYVLFRIKLDAQRAAN